MRRRARFVGSGKPDLAPDRIPGDRIRRKRVTVETRMRGLASFCRSSGAHIAIRSMGSPEGHYYEGSPGVVATLISEEGQPLYEARGADIIEALVNLHKMLARVIRDFIEELRGDDS